MVNPMQDSSESAIWFWIRLEKGNDSLIDICLVGIVRHYVKKFQLVEGERHYS